MTLILYKIQLRKFKPDGFHKTKFIFKKKGNTPIPLLTLIFLSK